MAIAAGHQDFRLIGESAAIRRLRADIDLAARSDAKVLLTGETGVGKEVVARLIHQRSARSRAPLVTLNCAGVADSLLESELFGHVKGSFTGAYRDKPGLLEAGASGTVFLDEVGEMSTRMQVVLLRFLETGEIQRVGAHRSQATVNVRVITATNRDLQAQIATGAFREDLYFRLNVIPLFIPPLRDRPDDIALLLQHYVAAYSRSHGVAEPIFAPDVMEALGAYRWPGNVRELKNIVERMVLKADGETVTWHDLPREILRGRVTASASSATTDQSVTCAPVSPVEELTAIMIRNGGSFWSTVYPRFMARDLTRADLRRIVHAGLESTNGSYRVLIQLFNVPYADYNRFLAFLRKHDCHLPFQRFRTAPVKAPLPTRSAEANPQAGDLVA